MSNTALTSNILKGLKDEKTEKPFVFKTISSHAKYFLPTQNL